MSKQKLTPWFEVGKHGQPKRKGWYDVRYSGSTTRHGYRFYWDGSRWFRAPGANATRWGNNPSSWPHDAWRGMEKP